MLVVVSLVLLGLVSVLVVGDIDGLDGESVVLLVVPVLLVTEPLTVSVAVTVLGLEKVVSEWLVDGSTVVSCVVVVSVVEAVTPSGGVSVKLMFRFSVEKVGEKVGETVDVPFIAIPKGKQKHKK